MFKVGDTVVMKRPLNSGCAVYMGEQAVVLGGIDPIGIKWLARDYEGWYTASQFDLYEPKGPW